MKECKKGNLHYYVQRGNYNTTTLFSERNAVSQAVMGSVGAILLKARNTQMLARSNTQNVSLKSLILVFTCYMVIVVKNMAY